MSDPFAVLGLPPKFDLSSDDLERRVRELQKALHPDRFVGRPAQERRMSLSKAVEVNEAYRTLRDDLSRAQALLALRGHAVLDAKPADPTFLMEVMELRESLSAVRGDVAKVRALGAQVARENDRARAQLQSLFDEGAPPAWIADVLGRMRYYRRFLDEVEALEESASSAASS